MRISDVTRGFIELLEEVSHDPDAFDDYDFREYIEGCPNPALVLYEFATYVHSEYL